MGRRILVVDDEEDIRLILEHILLQQGFEVALAGDGQQALDALAREPFDLMVLDVMMPVKDGFEVLAEMSDEAKERTPVVLLTAKGSDGDVMKGYGSGASYYITKPFDNITLLNAILFMLGELSEDEIAQRNIKI